MYLYIRALHYISTGCSPSFHLEAHRNSNSSKPKGTLFYLGQVLSSRLSPKFCQKEGKALKGTKLELPGIINHRH